MHQLDFRVAPLLMLSLLAILALSPWQPARGAADWQEAVRQGDYDLAVSRVRARQHDANALAVRALLDAAREKRLAAEPMWHALLHYKRPTYLPADMPPRWKSQIDSPWFFQSATGKTQPEAELEATLLAFFAENPDSADAPDTRMSIRSALPLAGPATRGSLRCGTGGAMP